MGSMDVVRRPTVLDQQGGGVGGRWLDHYGLAMHCGLNLDGFIQKGSTEGFWLSTQCLPISCITCQDLVQMERMTLSVPGT